MQFTNKFTENTSVDSTTNLQISPDRVFYQIDDFTVTQDTQPMPTETSVKRLKDLWGNKLPDYLEGMSKYLDDDIPVLTQEEYLREMKDLLVNKRKSLNRFTIKLAHSMSVDSVIVINKYPDHYVLMNELYANGKFVKALEYNFNEMIKEYHNLIKNS